MTFATWYNRRRRLAVLTRIFSMKQYCHSCRRFHLNPRISVLQALGLEHASELLDLKAEAAVQTLLINRGPQVSQTSNSNNLAAAAGTLSLRKYRIRPDREIAFAGVKRERATEPSSFATQFTGSMPSYILHISAFKWP